MTTKEEVLQSCTVEENVVKLPNIQLDRKLYQEVAKALELIGGKWKGGKLFSSYWRRGADWLHNVELIPITEEVWRKGNQGYI